MVKGSNGRTVDAARSDCQSRDSTADLLWVTNAEEMQWVTDHTARNWGIKSDWSQCTDCDRIEGAWIGLKRDTSDGQWKWLKNNEVVGVDM
jgi:hypothetical protein